MIGGPYRGSWSNVRRATTFWYRHRSRRRWRRKRATDNEIHVVGRHTRAGRRGALSWLLLLFLPALAVNLLGLWALGWVRDFGTWHLGSVLQVSLLLGVTLGMIARSLSASAPLWIRLLSFAVCLPFPIAFFWGG